MGEVACGCSCLMEHTAKWPGCGLPLVLGLLQRIGEVRRKERDRLGERARYGRQRLVHGLAEG